MARRRTERYPLGLCPRCGMDSGVRKQTDYEPVKYLVFCETCCYHTKWHPTQSAASNEWNRSSHEKN